jgi:hypothetical protein
LVASQRAPSVLTVSFSVKGVTRLILMGYSLDTFMAGSPPRALLGGSRA